MFSEPNGCDRADCDYYWAMGPNNEYSSYVDIYLEENINGWIAAGFSQNRQMVWVLTHALYSTHIQHQAYFRIFII